MDKTTGAVLAVIALLAWIAAAAWDAASPREWRKWLRTPGRMLTLSITVGAAVALSIGVYGQFQDLNSRAREWSVELISVSFAVLVIETASRRRAEIENRRRAEIEYKQSIIRQLASRSNDFALDAACIVVDKKWHQDGSLKGAILVHANLVGADLQGANLMGVDLSSAELMDAQLQNTNFAEAYLVNANLTGAFLWDAHLVAANLSGAVLANATLGSVHLQDAVLVDTDLTGASLWCANMINASAQEANFSNATLGYARLAGADFTGARLDLADLKNALYNSKTTWPDGFDPVAAGAVLIDDEEEQMRDDAQ